MLENRAHAELKTSYLETMPWLLQFYLHSLRVVCNGAPRGALYFVIGADVRLTGTVFPDDLVSIVSYSPPWF